MFKRILLLSVTLLFLSACASLLAPKVESQWEELKPGSYVLDKTHAALLFKIQHLGLSTYVGRFNTLEASLEFDPADLSATRLTAIVDMTSIDINDPGLAKDLMGSQWFNTARFPQAKFQTLSVRPIGDSEFEFVGELDWRGKKQPITLEVIFHGGANNLLTGKYTLGFSATGSFKRSDFGMDSYIPLVGDEVKLEGFAEFLRN